MRQRKAKDLEKRLRQCSAYMIQKPGDGSKDYFGTGGDRELFLEIGCGKGQFILKKALSNPDADYIAVEGQETVILRALEKADAKAQECREDSGGGLSNLKFMLTFVHGMEELFDENQLSGIYLNFSDPWPKARHAKRRLTHRDRLRDYGWALKKGGFIEIKTDNDELYDFTLEEIQAVGYRIAEQTRDLHGSDYAARMTTTEYEDKFSGKGKSINYVKVIVE